MSFIYNVFIILNLINAFLFRLQTLTNVKTPMSATNTLRVSTLSAATRAGARVGTRETASGAKVRAQ